MLIGIFGGSFNPIHSGHAMLVNWLASNAPFDRIWLMVSPQNPLKSASDYAVSDAARIRMVEMVARRIPKVDTSAFEFSLPRPSYTIDTLGALHDKFPDDEFALIIGADNWADFPKWRDHNKIISDYRIFIYPRRGYEIDPATLPPSVTYLADAPIIEVSSTHVRNLLADGGNASFFLPDDVLAYILRHNLYIKH